jgi:hypothetical protein
LTGTPERWGIGSPYRMAEVVLSRLSTPHDTFFRGLTAAGPTIAKRSFALRTLVDPFLITGHAARFTYPRITTAEFGTANPRQL